MAAADSAEESFTSAARRVHSLCSTVNADADAPSTAMLLDDIATSLTLLLTSLDALKAVASTEKSKSMEGDPQEAARDERSGSRAALLSLNALRGVYTALELLWALALGPFVERHVGCSIAHASYPKSLLVSEFVLKQLSQRVSATPIPSLWQYLNLIAQVVFSTSFTGMVVDRNFRRVFLGLMVFAEPSVEETAIMLSNRDEASARVQAITADHRLHYLIVSELKTVVARVTPLFRSRLTSTFSSVIMSERGVETVIRGFLQGVDDSFLSAVMGHVSRLVLAAPAGMPRHLYLENIVLQVATLLRETASTSSATSSVMLQQLMAILVQLCVEKSAAGLLRGLCASIDTRQGVSLADESEVQISVVVACALLSSGPVPRPVLTELRTSGVAICMIDLAMSRGAQTSFLTSRVREFCVALLLALEEDEAADMLWEALLKPPSDIVFGPGSSGGVEIRRAEKPISSPIDDMLLPSDTCDSDLIRFVENMRDAAKIRPSGDSDRLDSVLSRLFIRLLGEFLRIDESCDVRAARALLDLLECAPMDCLLKGGSVCRPLSFVNEDAYRLRIGLQILTLVSTFLTTFIAEMELGQLDSDEEQSRSEVAETVIMILSAIVSFGSTNRPEAEEEQLTSIASLLRVVGPMVKSREVSQAAADVGLMIVTRKAPSTVDAQHAISSSSVKELLMSCTSLLHAKDAPSRAIAVRTIVLYLRDPANVTSSDDKLLLLVTLVQLLSDAESFVYLSALHAIAVVADSDRRLVIKFLIVQLDGVGPTRDKVVLVEALVLIVRKAGQMASEFISAIVSACIRIVRRRPSELEEKELSSAANLSTLRCNPLAEDVLVEPVGLKVADGVLLRQSAVSLLAEVVAGGGWSLFPFLVDVLDVASGVFSMEGSRAQCAVAARRSAAFLLRSLLHQQKERLVQTEGVAHLSKTYTVLKIAADDADNVVKHHAECALGDLDSFMRSQLFRS